MEHWFKYDTSLLLSLNDVAAWLGTVLPKISKMTYFCICLTFSWSCLPTSKPFNCSSLVWIINLRNTHSSLNQKAEETFRPRGFGFKSPNNRRMWSKMGKRRGRFLYKNLLKYAWNQNWYLPGFFFEITFTLRKNQTFWPSKT